MASAEGRGEGMISVVPVPAESPEPAASSTGACKTIAAPAGTASTTSPERADDVAVEDAAVDDVPGER